MIFCWSLQAVPELQGVPKRRQRALWREAMTRSATPRRLLGALAVRFLASLALAGLSLWLWPSVSSLWLALVALAGSGLAYDVAVQEPAARRWLREHAHELERYVPE